MLTCLAARLAPGSPGLEVELLAPGLERLQTLLGPAGQVHVDTGPHAGPEVGGAGVDVAVLGVQHELAARLGPHGVAHSLDATGEAVKHGTDIAAALHGDDPELVLLVDPGQEGFVLVVENAATLGPVTLHAGHLEVGVSGDEEEVVIHQLLPDLLAHAGEGEVSAGQVSGQVSEGLLHQVLHINPLLLGDAGRQSEPIDAAANPDPGGVDGGGGVDVPVDLVHVHVAGVDTVSGDAMVLLNDGVEDISEDLDTRKKIVRKSETPEGIRSYLVRVPVSGIDAAVLVVEVGGAGDGLGEGEL